MSENMKFDSVVIDAMNLAYRSWWKVKDLCTKTNIATGLEFGFIKNMLSHVRENYPAKVLLAWDGRPSRCLDIYPEYKAGRVKPDKKETEAPWGPRLERVRKVLGELLQNLYDPNMEADEQIARYVWEQEQKGANTLIFSTDDDMKQLVSEHTFINDWSGEIYDREKVKEKLGVYPERVPLLRAVSGDKSDNIPGIPRISSEAKISLANLSQNLEDMLTRIDICEFFSVTQKQKLIDGKEIIKRNFQLMNLRGDTQPPIREGIPKGNLEPVLNLCRELEFDSLLAHKGWTLLIRLSNLFRSSFLYRIIGITHLPFPSLLRFN